ncbi:MAG: hypothetical protein V4674_00985 [Patescibacteria group bacterium]
MERTRRTRVLVGSSQDPITLQLMGVVHARLEQIRPEYELDTLFTSSSSELFGQLVFREPTLVISLARVEDPDKPSVPVPIPEFAARVKYTFRKSFFVVATGIDIPGVRESPSVDAMVLITPDSSVETMARLLAHDKLAELWNLHLPNYTVFEKKHAHSAA